MSVTRIYKYKNSSIRYKHIKLNRELKPRVKRDEKQEEYKKVTNEQKITDILKFDEALSRAKRNIIDIILCNDFEYFCTFTFKPDKFDRYDIKECYKAIRKFFDNYKQKYSKDFIYIIVPEFHSDGAIHFHGCCSGFRDDDLIIPEMILKKVGDEVVLVPNTLGYLRWLKYDKNMGIFNCSKIKSNTACAYYITKYITKNMKQIPKGIHLYSCSRSLERPELICDEKDIGLLAPVYYQNEFCSIGYTRFDGQGFDVSIYPDWVQECIKNEKNASELSLSNELIYYEYEQINFA